MSKTVIDAKEYPRIVELYNSGLSQAELETLYNVSHGVIKRILVKNHVELRDNSHKKRSYSIDENYFDTIDTPNKAYILGLLYADGCNATKNRMVKLCLQARDAYILERIRDEMKSTHPIRIQHLHHANINHQDSHEFVVVNKHLSNTLSNIGVVRAKSLVLTFPTWLDSLFISHFVRGYFDGDGHIRMCGSYVEISGTENFCRGLMSVCCERGIKTNVRRLPSKSGMVWSLYICNRQNALAFLEFIYHDAELFLTRKYEVYQRLYEKYTYAA